MLKESSPGLENLLYLRDVVIPWMQEHPSQVDLDVIESTNSCGTHRCLLGWYCAMRYGLVGEAARDFYDDDREIGEFAITPEQAVRLFEARTFGGSLEDRAAYLDHLIEERVHA